MGDMDRYFDDEGCREALHRLYDFLDGELTDETLGQIGHHLDNCQPCLQAFDFEVELRHMIATKCRDHAPEHLRERIAVAIRLEQEVGRTNP
jgi:mycothiol system anti-sigma-R factor